jgi:hypothetical protein
MKIPERQKREKIIKSLFFDIIFYFFLFFNSSSSYILYPQIQTRIQLKN